MASLLSTTQEKPPPEDGNHGWWSQRLVEQGREPTA